MFILYWIAFQVGTNSVNIAYLSKKRGRRTFRSLVLGGFVLPSLYMDDPSPKRNQKEILSFSPILLGEG